MIRRLALALTLLAAPFFAVAQEAVFEVDQLNPGLEGTRDDLDLSTPQSSIETFLEAAASQNWDDAAHVLDLRDLDVTDQATLGPELAKLLSIVLDRKVVISWSQLLERPDALDENASTKHPLAGQPRRSLVLGLLELGDRSVAVRLNRLKPENQEAVWVFSRQTVDNVPALYEEHGPTQLEQMLPDWAREDTTLGLRLWEIFAIPMILAAAAAAGTIIWRLFGWMGEKTPSEISRAVARGLRWPATISVVALILHVATDRVLVVSGVVSAVLAPLIVLGFVASLMVLFVTIIDAILDRLMPADTSDLSAPEAARERGRITAISAARRIVVVVAVVLAVGLTLSSANVFRTLGFSLLAGAGALTLVLGFAAREVLGNIMASLQISLNRSARVGDQLVYNDELCTVERINFTFVQLHVWDDTRLIVPVSKFVSEEFYNRNLETPGMTRTAIIKLSNRIDLDKLRDAFQAYARDREEIDEDDAKLEIVSQDETGMGARFSIPVPDPTAGWEEEVALREHMIKVAQSMEEEAEDDYLPHMGLSPNPRSKAARRPTLPDDDEDDDG